MIVFKEFRLIARNLFLICQVHLGLNQNTIHTLEYTF